MSEKNESKIRLKTKVFKIQNSYIDQIMNEKNVKSTFHLILSIVAYFLIANVFYYLANPSKIQNEIDFILVKLKHSSLFCYQILIYIPLLFFVFHPLTKKWVENRCRTENQKRVDFIFLSTILSILGLYNYLVIKAILYYDTNIILTFAILVEKVRLLMKTYAFILESKRKQEISWEKEKKDAKFTTHKQLLYYFVAPTLVYRDEYPRLDKRDWKKIISLTIQFATGIYVMFIITFRITIPTFSDFGKNPVTYNDLINVFFLSFVIGGLYCLLVFYLFLHLYLNIFSQLLRFGDRIFYEDWWTCTEINFFLRKWNVLVHDWIHSYLYTPLVYYFSGNKSLASLVVVLVSSIVHEYIIALSIRQINPILTFLFSGSAIFFMVLDCVKNFFSTKNDSKKVSEESSLQFSIMNTFNFFRVFLGWSFMLIIYSVGYYERENCHKNYSNWFPQYSLDCLKIDS